MVYDANPKGRQLHKWYKNQTREKKIRQENRELCLELSILNTFCLDKVYVVFQRNFSLTKFGDIVFIALKILKIVTTEITFHLKPVFSPSSPN